MFGNLSWIQHNQMVPGKKRIKRNTGNGLGVQAVLNVWGEEKESTQEKEKKKIAEKERNESSLLPVKQL